jgi:hypothetical protein
MFILGKDTMLHLPTLYALKDYLSNIKFTNVNLDMQADIVEIEINNDFNKKNFNKKNFNKKIYLTITDEIVQGNTGNIVRFSEEIFGELNNNKINNYEFAVYTLRSVIINKVRNAYIHKINNQTLLTYSVGNYAVKEKVINNVRDDLIITTSMVYEGYKIFEERGLFNSVITPSGIQRTLDSAPGIECNCHEFNGILKKRSPCNHLTFHKVFINNKNLFRKYNLITTEL